MLDLKKSYRILIVEDLPSDAELNMREVKKILPNAVFEIVETEPDFLQQISAFSPDLILSDYSMPRFDGLRALSLTLKHAPDIPLIIVTGSINEDTAVECMKAGASNYVIKDQMKRLSSAIEHALIEKEMMAAKRQAQRELDAQRTLFNALTENSFDIITIVSVEGVIVYESKAVEHILGIESGSRVGTKVFDSVHPDDTERVMREFAEMLKIPESRSSIELRFRHKNGNYIWIEASGQNLLHHPDINGILVNSRDVTARKNAQMALIREQMFLTGIIENSDNLIFVKDTEGRYELVNRKWESITGKDRAQVLGKNDEQLFPGPDGVTFRENDLLAMKGSKAIEKEEMLGEGEGARYFLSLKFPLYDSLGKVRGMCGMSHEITEKRRMQQALIESEARFRSMIEGAPEPVFIQTNQSFTYVNPAAVKLFGAESSDDILGRKVVDLFHPDYHEIILQRINRVNLQRESIHDVSEFRCLKLDGTLVWVETSAEPIVFDGIQGALVFVKDITNRKLAESEIVLNNKRLESLLRISQYQTKDVNNLLDFALNEAITLTGSKYGYIYHYHEDRKQFVLNTWSKDVMPDCMVLNPQTTYDLDKTGFWGEAVRQRKPMLNNHFQMPNALKKGYPEGHVQLEKFLTIPVLKFDKIVAVVGVANKPDDYTEADIRQLELMMGSVWNYVEFLQSEELVRVTEEKFTNIYNNSPAGLYRTSADGDIIDANPSLVAMLGFDSLEELQKIKVQDDYVDRKAKEAFDQQIREKGYFRGVSCWYRKDSSILWVEEQAKAVFDDEGVLLYHDGYVIDITDRMIAVEKTAITEKYYRTLIEKAPDGIVMLESDGKIRYASPSAYKMFGYSFDITEFPEPNESTHPDDLSSVLQKIEDIMLHPDHTAQVEYRFKKADGDWKWIESTFSNMLADPVLNAIIINFRDISDRKQIEGALKENERKYRILFEGAADGIFILKDGVFVDCNETALKQFSCNKEYILGSDPAKLSPEMQMDGTRSAEASENYILEGLRLGKVLFSWLHKRADGTLFDAEISLQVIELEGEKVIQAIVRDVTERLKMMVALSESEKKYRLLFENITQGFALHEIVCNESGAPVDYRFLSINPAFEVLTSLKADEICGKTASEVLPGIEPSWLEIYGRVALTGEPVQFEEYSKTLNKHFEVWAFSPDKNKFATVFSDITDQVMARNQLLESEEKYRMIAENTADTITIFNLDFSIRYVSPSIKNLLGYTVAEYLELSLKDVLTPDSFKQIVELFHEEMMVEASGTGDSERSRTVVLKEINSKGNEVWIESRASFIRDQELNPVQMLVLSRDITSRIESEMNLHKTREEFKAIFENNSAAIAIIDPDTTITMVNDAYAQISGYSRQEVTGMSWTDQIPPEDLKRMLEYNRLRMIDPSSAPDKYEFSFYRKDGVVRHALMSVAVIPSSKKIVASFSDITERIVAEKEMRLSEEKFRNLIEFAPDAFFQGDDQGNFILVNDKAIELTGFSRDELLKMNMIQLFPPDVQERKPLRYEQLKSGESIKSTRIIETRSKQRVHVEMSSRAMPDGTYQSFMRDITARVRAQHDLRNSEEKFRKAFESHPGIVGISTIEDGIYLDVNDNFYKILGWKREEVVGRKVKDLNIYRNYEERERIIGIILQDNKLYNYEVTLLTRNGEERLGLFSAEIIEIDGRKCVMTQVFDITERKEAERQLHESRILFENLANMSPVGIFRTDAAGATTYVNPKWCELSGLSFEAALGDGWLDALVPEDRKGVLDGWRKKIADRAPSVAEYRFLRPDGSIVWVFGRAEPEIIDGEMTGYVGTITDFTEKKLVEDELRESRQLFESLANVSPVGIFRTDARGFTTYVNPKWCEITGLTFDEAMGTDWYASIHPEDADQSLSGWEKAVENKTESVAEFRFNHKDGDIRWVFGKAVPEFQEGVLKGYIGTITDITERKLYENSLIENDVIMRRAEQVAGFGNWAFDFNTGMVRVSEGAALIYGLEPREYSIKEIKAIPLIKYRDALDQEMELLKLGVKNYSIEFEIKRPDNGDIRLIHSIAVFEKQQNVVFGVIRDITERRRIEQALIEREKKEKQLVEEELARTKDALVRSTRLAAVGQVSATIAHDLRNPLGAVRNAAFYLKRKMDQQDPKVTNYLQIIDSEIETADKIISNLLQMAKVKEPEKIKTDLRDLIEQAMGNQYKKLNIEVKLSLDRDPFVLSVDATQMVQVFRNLFENSSHTSDQNVCVRVQGQFSENAATILVCDNGPGISADVIETLFEPLVTTKAKGTGLGLTICKQIVEKHGGSMTLENHEGFGACFKIVLPL